MTGAKHLPRFGAIGHGEKAHWVQNLNFLTLGLCSVLNLQVATRVRRGDDCGACFFDMAQFLESNCCDIAGWMML